MRHVPAITVCLTTIACGGARHAPTVPGEPTPFSVSSIGTSYGIQVRLVGSIIRQDRWVYLVVPTGAVRTYQLDRQDYWDLRLRAAVASCQGRGFEIISEGRAARLAPLLGLTRDAATLDTTTRAMRDTMRLDVGVPAGFDMNRSWVVLVVEWPFQSVMATYAIHTDVPLGSGSRRWEGRAANLLNERCR